MKRIRIFLATALALLIFGAVAPAQATVGHRFVTGVSTPQQLAVKIQASLAKDSIGRHAIDDVSCSRDRACGTPEDLLDMILKSDPGSGLKDVSQLPAYVSKLVLKTAPKGRWWMACKTGTGDVSSNTKWNCLTREFHAGEPGYANPVTGNIVLARDCTNPVGKEEQETDCAKLVVWLKPGDEIHYGWGKVAYPQGKCELRLQKAGDDERGSPALDECPFEKCNFNAPAHELGDIKVYDSPRISYRAKTEGWYTLWQPKEVTTTQGLFMLCIVRPDGTQTFTKLIDAKSYVDGEAYVAYPDTVSKIPSSWRGTQHYVWLAAKNTKPGMR